MTDWESTMTETDVNMGCYVTQFDANMPAAWDTVFPQHDLDLEWKLASRRTSEAAPKLFAVPNDTFESKTTESSQTPDDAADSRQRGLHEAMRLSARQKCRNRRQLQVLSGQAIADLGAQQPAQPMHLSGVFTQEKQRQEQIRDLPHATYVHQHYEELVASASRRELILHTFRTQHQERTELETYSGQRA